MRGDFLVCETLAIKGYRDAAGVRCMVAATARRPAPSPQAVSLPCCLDQSLGVSVFSSVRRRSAHGHTGRRAKPPGTCAGVQARERTRGPQEQSARVSGGRAART